jgi:hypothetical protein
VCDRCIDVGDRRYSKVDQMERLAPQGSLQSIGDMAGELLSQADGMLTERCVERDRSVDHRWIGTLPADDLDERHEMRRVEGMPDHDSLGMLGSRLDRSGRKARRTAGKDRPRRRDSIQPPKQLLLELDALRPILLHEIGAGDSVFGCGDKPEALNGGTRT